MRGISITTSWDPILSRRILTDKQLASLGSVVAESSYLERTVEIVISHLLNVDKETRDVVLNKAMFQAKIDLMGELGKRRLRSKKRKQVFSMLVSRLKANNGERVTAVHGIWWWESPDDFKVPPTGNAKATHDRGGTMSAHSLDKLAAKISASHAELLDFYATVWIVQSVRRREKRRAAKRSKAIAEIGLR